MALRAECEANRVNRILEHEKQAVAGALDHLAPARSDAWLNDVRSHRHPSLMRTCLVASHEPRISDDIDEYCSGGAPFRPPLIRAVFQGRVADIGHHHGRNNFWAPRTTGTLKNCSKP